MADDPEVTHPIVEPEPEPEPEEPEEPDKDKPDHPRGGPPGQTGEHPRGGPPGQAKKDDDEEAV